LSGKARFGKSKVKSDETHIAEEKMVQSEAAPLMEAEKKTGDPMHTSEKANVVKMDKKAEDDRIAEEKKKARSASIIAAKKKAEEKRALVAKKIEEEERIVEEKKKAKAASIISAKKKVEEKRALEAKKNEIQDKISEDARMDKLFTEVDKEDIVEEKKDAEDLLIVQETSLAAEEDEVAEAKESVLVEEDPIDDGLTKENELFEVQRILQKELEDKLSWKDGALDAKYEMLGHLSDFFPANFELTIPNVSTDTTPGSLVLLDRKPKVISTEDMWDVVSSIRIQGGSIRTCNLHDRVQRVEVLLTTTGRPLSANLDLWHGPDNIPQKISVYSDDGNERPFRTTIECAGEGKSVGIRNTGSFEMPIIAGCDTDFASNVTSINPSHLFRDTGESAHVQGKAVYTKAFPTNVESVQVKLESHGRPLSARLELLQGPNNIKQVVEVSSQDGCNKPFYGIFETPGSGNVVRIVNTASIEFPFEVKIDSFIDSGENERLFGDSGFNWK
jgi:hypothetical protein